MNTAYSKEIELTRRAFLKNTGACALGAICGGVFFRGFRSEVFGAELAAGGKVTSIKADEKYWDKASDNAVACSLCPNMCSLKPGAVSYCRTRRNHDGVLFTHAYSNPTIMTLDPVEKIPFYHYMPGSAKVLVLATGGCNLHCAYCQNWEQSQAEPDKLKNFHVTPEEAVKGAQDKNCTAIAFTYTDPVAFFEYARDIARLGKEKGIPVLFGTAGYLNRKPLEELCKYAAGFSVTLKGFSEDFYKKVTGVSLAPVLKSLETIKKSGAWLEVVHLPLPTVNDDPREFRAMCKWLNTNMGNDVPLHLERFSPLFRLKDLPATPIGVMEDLRNIAMEEGIKFVYISNYFPHDANQTYCPKCKTVVLKRLGFTIIENKISAGTCAACGTKLAGIWPSAEQIEKTKKEKAEQSSGSAKYQCGCGYIYDPAKNNNIPFESLSADWKCPACGAPKNSFKKMA